MSVASYYLYVVWDEDKGATPDSVFYMVDDATLASNLCDLFTDEYTRKGIAGSFHFIDATMLKLSEQILIEEAIEQLYQYDDPDPYVYDPPPSINIITRAQYAFRADDWEKRLRQRASATEPSDGKSGGDTKETTSAFTEGSVEVGEEVVINAGLNLLMRLAQTYYKILELVTGAPCSVTDVQLNQSYLWVIESIDSLLTKNSGLKDFPEAFEPILPDLYPSTVSEINWTDIVAPNVEGFMSTVQKFVTDKGMHPPEEQSTEWMFVELFKPSMTAAVEAAKAYRKQMDDHFNNLQKRMPKRSSSQTNSESTGKTDQAKKGEKHTPPNTAKNGEQQESMDIKYGATNLPDGVDSPCMSKLFEPHEMLWNDRTFIIEKPVTCFKGHDLENVSLESYYPELETDGPAALKDIPWNEVRHLHFLTLVGYDKTLLIHIMLRYAAKIYPERLESSGVDVGRYEGGALEVDGEWYELKRVIVKETDHKDRNIIEVRRRVRAEIANTEFGKATDESYSNQAGNQTQLPSDTNLQDKFEWVKQSELIRALHRVIGEEESPHKSTLTRAAQNGEITSNGESGRKLLLQVDSVKAWLTQKRNREPREVDDVADAIINEIRARLKKR